ncbi:MAG: hypothetical protein WC543_00900 [Candidatus Omnitrophota bacterium]
MKRLDKAQSTLEYVIILAAVVGAILVVASALKSKMSTEVYPTMMNKMSDAVKKI